MFYGVLQGTPHFGYRDRFLFEIPLLAGFKLALKVGTKRAGIAGEDERNAAIGGGEFEEGSSFSTVRHSGAAIGIDM